MQYASQIAIAAIEKAGGRVRTAYYDEQSLEVDIFCILFLFFYQAAVDPIKWFKKGLPVPARKLPPSSLLEFVLVFVFQCIF